MIHDLSVHPVLRIPQFSVRLAATLCCAPITNQQANERARVDSHHISHIPSYIPSFHFPVEPSSDSRYMLVRGVSRYPSVLGRYLVVDSYLLSRTCLQRDYVKVGLPFST